jgi:hypothetical protein
MNEREKLTHKRVKVLIKTLSELGVIEDGFGDKIQGLVNLEEGDELLSKLRTFPKSSYEKKSGKVVFSIEKERDDEKVVLVVNGKEKNLQFSEDSLTAEKSVDPSKYEGDVLSVYAKSNRFGKGSIYEV